MASHPALQRWQLGGLSLQSRVVKAATFEGATPQGRVTDALIAHHARLARHRVGLTTVAYAAVHDDGRSFVDQLVMTPSRVHLLRRLTDAVRAAGGAASVQLAHGGGFTKLPPADGRAPGGPSPGFNAYGALQGLARVRGLTADEIDERIAQFAEAARWARAAGFDAVEVHAGHGYLLSQFLSPAINRRADRWGADRAGRARLAVEVVRAVRAAVGPDVPVLVKLNTSDGVRGGLQIGDAVDAARRLVDAGATAIVPSGGLVQRSAFHLLRGRAPLREMVAAETDLRQRWALRLFGRWWVRPVPYRPRFFWEDAARIRDAVDAPVGLLGGVEGGADLRRAVDDGFAFAVLGRALIADPDLLDRVSLDPTATTRCTRCNACVASLRGTHCALDGPEPAIDTTGRAVRVAPAGERAT